MGELTEAYSYWRKHCKRKNTFLEAAELMRKQANSVREEELFLAESEMKESLLNGKKLAIPFDDYGIYHFGNSPNYKSADDIISDVELFDRNVGGLRGHKIFWANQTVRGWAVKKGVIDGVATFYTDGKDNNYFRSLFVPVKDVEVISGTNLESDLALSDRGFYVPPVVFSERGWDKDPFSILESGLHGRLWYGGNKALPDRRIIYLDGVVIQDNPCRVPLGK